MLNRVIHGLGELTFKGESVFFKLKKSEQKSVPMAAKTNRHAFNHRPEIASIIVEEEERVRRFWREFFDERGMKLYLYDSEESFLEIHQLINFPVQFYFDQDIGANTGAGVRLASLVKNSPYRVSTNLVTSYPSQLFYEEMSEKLLDSVLPKYPNEIFGANFFPLRMRREFDEKGREVVIAESLQNLIKAIQPLSEINSNLITKQKYSDSYQKEQV